MSEESEQVVPEVISQDSQWIQKDLGDSAQERVFDLIVGGGDPVAWIIESLDDKTCRSFVSLHKDRAKEEVEQEVTVKGEELEAAQLRVGYIVSRIPSRLYKPEPGEPELPGLP